MTAPDVTAGEIIYAVLRVWFFWPLYGLLYLCLGMYLKMRWVRYRTRTSFGGASGPTNRTGSPTDGRACDPSKQRGVAALSNTF